MPRQGSGSMESRNMSDAVRVHPDSSSQVNPGTYGKAEGITPDSIRARTFDLLPAFLYSGNVAKEVDSFLHDTATKLAMAEAGQISA